MRETKQPSYYEVLDVSMSAKPEMIRTAYIRAKNTYARDSVAVYTLFEPDESRRIIEQIEEAYNILSDPEKRRKYDEAHGYMRMDTESALAEAGAANENKTNPFVQNKKNIGEDAYLPRDMADDMGLNLDANSEANASEATPQQSSAIERLQRSVAVSAAPPSATNFNTVRPHKVSREYNSNPEMEEKLKRADNITGNFLKEVREYKRATIDEIMDITKINRNYIVALEADELSKLPAAVYVRGFVSQYAKALGLEGDRVAASYMAYFKSRRP